MSRKPAYWFGPQGQVIRVHGSHASTFNGNKGEGYGAYSEGNPYAEEGRKALENGWIRVRLYNHGWHIQWNQEDNDRLDEVIRYLFFKHPRSRHHQVTLMGLDEGFYGTNLRANEWNVYGSKYESMYEIVNI